MALRGPVRLWEALGGSVSRRDTGEIHKGLIAYIPSTYLKKPKEIVQEIHIGLIVYIPF